MFTSAWILACAPALFGADEFHERCAALSSPEAIERAAAERWLAAHLEPARYSDLLTLARGADAEVRARLVRILAADPRHLELALTLAAEPSSELSELGVDAVRAVVAVLEPRFGEPARRGQELGTALERLAGSAWPRLLVLAPGRPLGELALELEFTGAIEVGFTLDPALATRVPRGNTELVVGPWEEALDQLLRAYGFGVEGHGLPKGRAADTEVSGFLRVAPENERPRSGVEHVGEWLLLVARPGDEALRVQAARNLAATGLAPVLSWLGRRAASGDAAGLEGVLLAGARGRIAPARPDTALESAVDALRSTVEAMRQSPGEAEPAAAVAPPNPVEVRIAAIADALAAERVDVVLAPILALAGADARHFEVSVRLRTPDGELIDARNVASGAGLLPLLDALSVRHAAGFALNLERRGRSGAVFSNVAGESLESDGFVGDVAGRYAQG
ncbi:MAG: hypothetical protein ABL998_11560, partial [Planctomycetota bacterium]